jgi:hypothetical protein
MALEHRAQPMGEQLELFGPAQGGVEVAVDLGQDAVQQQILELFLIPDVVVEGAGDDPEAGGQAAHGEGLGAVLGDDRQRLGDDALAGELGTAVLVVHRRAEPERARLPVGRGRTGRCRCALVGRCLGSVLHADPPSCSSF